MSGISTSAWVYNRACCCCCSVLLFYPKACDTHVLQLHNSSSSSILASSVGPRLTVGTFPSELPLSFWLPIIVWARLLRTLSSKPGRDARCFLNGEATPPASVGASVAELEGAPEEDASAVAPGAGVPELGDTDDSVAEAVGRPKGSAEC